MADSWEDEADEVVIVKPIPALATDKWDGEDVEEDLPDAWDAQSDKDEDTEKGKTESASAAQKKRRKNIAEIQEKKRLEAEERKKKMEEESPGSDQVSSGLTEKERQLLQEESDLLVVMDTFGSAEQKTISSGKSIDFFEPQTPEDFEQLSKLISAKMRKYETSLHFPAFLESTFRDCVVELECEDLRKLSTMFTAMVSEKQKLQRAGKSKKKGKSVKIERDPAATFDDEVYDEYDDFI